MEGLNLKTAINRMASPKLLKQIKAQMIREGTQSESISESFARPKAAICDGV